MLKWIKASYGKSEIDPRAYITTMEFVGMNGAYHVYRLSDGSFVTTFINQPNVRNYVDLNLGSIFLVRFLLPASNKYEYKVELNKAEVFVRTLASVIVLVQGSEETPRILHYDSSELAYIE